MYQISSTSSEFCKRYYTKNILVSFLRKMFIGEMTQDNGHHPFKVIQNHRVRYTIDESPYTTFTDLYYLTSYLSPFPSYRRVVVKL